jgi:hypothetical protein
LTPTLGGEFAGGLGGLCVEANLFGCIFNQYKK